MIAAQVGMSDSGFNQKTATTVEDLQDISTAPPTSTDWLSNLRQNGEIDIGSPCPPRRFSNGVPKQSSA